MPSLSTTPVASTLLSAKCSPRVLKPIPRVRVAPVPASAQAISVGTGVRNSMFCALPACALSLSSTLTPAPIIVTFVTWVDWAEAGTMVELEMPSPAFAGRQLTVSRVSARRTHVRRWSQTGW